jgi:hypothetical protein
VALILDVGPVKLSPEMELGVEEHPTARMATAMNPRTLRAPALPPFQIFSVIGDIPFVQR